MIGDIVVVSFPFSNLQGTKRRPALVLADCGGNDLVLCQITSQNIRDKFAIAITPDDTFGKLLSNSNIRPNKLFTMEKSTILYKLGVLNDEKFSATQHKLSALFGYGRL